MTADKTSQTPGRGAEQYLYKDLTYVIRGAFFEVYNTLGPGFKEDVYHHALAAEFALREIPFSSKVRLSINRLGFLVNFGGDRLDIRRRVFDTARISGHLRSNQRSSASSCIAERRH